MDVNAVLTQMRELGLEADSLDTSGQLVRVPVSLPRPDKGRKKSGWYVVHEFRLSSGGFGLAGAFGNYKLDEKRKVGMPEGSLSEADRAEYERRRKQAQERAAEEARRTAEACAKRAQKIWAGLPDEGKSPYLDKKGIRAYGLRFSRGSVVVPLYRIGDPAEGQAFTLSLVGLQFIDPEGSKKFLTGTPKKGAFHWLGNIPEVDCPFVVVEGYATGASVHMATGLPVAVAFDAGNLEPVCRALRGALPEALICVAGDNDSETQGNPGASKARAAASAVGGVWVVPDFAEGTDGAD